MDLKSSWHCDVGKVKDKQRNYQPPPDPASVKAPYSTSSINNLHLLTALQIFYFVYELILAVNRSVREPLYRPSLTEHCFDQSLDSSDHFLTYSAYNTSQPANRIVTMNAAPALAAHGQTPTAQQMVDNFWTVFAHNVNSGATSFIEMPITLKSTLQDKGLEILALRFR